MNSHNTSGKFHAAQENVKDLLENNPRFKRIYEEYDQLSADLWNFETSEGLSITDDFLNYLKSQTVFLETELEEFILQQNTTALT